MRLHHPDVAVELRSTCRHRLLIGGGLAALWIGSAVGASAQCRTLEGEVVAGGSYEHAFGDGLLFRLAPNAPAPPNPPGWTIEVRAGPEGRHDFVWVATPPYRWSNPRYVDTSYGVDARRAVAWDVRTFGFVADEEEYGALSRAVGFLVSSRPADMTADRYRTVADSVEGLWRTMLERTGRGELRITDAEVSGATPERPGGRIERLAFTVSLCPGG